MVVFFVVSLYLLSCFQAAAEAPNRTRQSISRVDATWQTWGPYRPGLYVGVRPLVPDTLLMGVMWASGDSREKMLNTIRDTCEQNDGMQGYGWSSYDPRVGGSQTINDQKLHINLTTDFIKKEDGDSWALRISALPGSDAPSNVRTTIIVHAAIEKIDGTKSLVCGDQKYLLPRRNDAEAICRGEMPGLGSFEFQLAGDAGNKVLHKTAVKSVEVPEDKIWQAKSIFSNQIKATPGKGVAIDDTPGRCNMHFIQMTFEGSFNLTLSYRDLEAAILDVNALDTSLHRFVEAFPANVEKVFPRKAPFDQAPKYGNFTRAIISNLMGGLGFFHGDSKVDYTHAPEYDETDLRFWQNATQAMAKASITTTPPTSLLSFTPSRPFFPRGFLWDEGFHLLPVIEWDLDLAVSVLQSWLNLMDEDGWIGREQILGPEARSRVPSEFQTQYPHYTNPPTLSLLIPILLSKLTGTSPYKGHPSIYLSSKPAAHSMLKSIYPLLARHYTWFRRTQSGNFTPSYPRPANAIPGEGYRWRGRTPSHCLTSGLDDYPRADPPHPGELHVDALSWIGASAMALNQLSLYLDKPTDAETYARHLSDVQHNLDALHWSPTEKTYCDATVDTETNEYKHVCRQGYISLFPLLLGLMNATHPNLPAVLDLVADEDRLWSRYGLRSLSKSDEGYHTGENYWRGAVWMNLNVLAVLRMRDLGVEGQQQVGAVGLNESLPGGGGEVDGRMDVQRPALELAGGLRERLVRAVYDSWEGTGFFWEQYSDLDGQGSRSRAFTGWTACVILLMGLEFEGGGTGESQDGGGVDGGKDSGRAVLGVGGLVVALLVVVGVVACRKRLVGLVGLWLDRWRAVKGQRYEPVKGIDLDERGRGSER